MREYNLVIITLLLGLLWASSTVSQNCKRREKSVEDGRKCKKECIEDNDCSGEKKTCSCDDVCGMSCFNPESLCESNPEEIENGNVQYDDTKYGSTATYSCEDGFQLKGNRERKCRSDKKWSGESPNCIATACSYPPTITSAFHNTDTQYFQVGDVVTYICRHGYILSGNPNITCREDNTWSTAGFLCVKVSCGNPEKPLNGYIEASDFNFGSWVTYHCDKGYQLEEPTRARRYCSTTGTWSGRPAVCTIKTCLPPEDPENGRAEWRDRDYGTIVKYSCDQGYLLDGNEEGICNENSTWGQMPTCKVDINCRFETSARPLCGYSSVGTAEWERIFVEKNRDGLPSYAALKQATGTAKMRSPTIRDAETSCLQLYYYFESVLISNDNIRITMNDERVANIAPDGVRVPSRRWVGFQTTLVPVRQEITFEIVVKGDTKIWIDDLLVSNGECESYCARHNPCENGGTCVDEIGSKYYCSCSEQYRGRRCEIEITCSRPILNNGRVDGPGKVTFGLVITFRCNGGYKLRGASQSQCTRNGLSQKLPECIEARQVAGVCPEGYHEYGSMCYEHFKTAKSYVEAEATCASYGGRMAIVQSSAVGKFLMESAPIYWPQQAGFWIGLRIINSVLVWISGDAYIGVGGVTIDRFHSGISNCAAYNLWHETWSGWKWNIGFLSCDQRRKFICETWKKTASSYVLQTPASSRLNIDGLYRPVPGLNTWGGRQAYRKDGGKPYTYLYFDYSTVGQSTRWVVGEYNVADGLAVQWYVRSYTDASLPDKIAPDSWENIRRYGVKITITEHTMWNHWLEWKCSVTCEKGVEQRRRTCEDGEPGSMNCKGEDVESRSCNLYACPGSSSNEVEFNGMRYLFVLVSGTWYSAREKCNSRGMNLAISTSFEVQNILLRKIRQISQRDNIWKAYWINARKQNRQWKFENGTLMNIHQDLWNTGEPNGYPESLDCGQLGGKGWNDNRCDSSARFICEMELEDPCKENPCSGNRICRSDGRKYTCACPPGTIGPNCVKTEPIASTSRPPWTNSMPEVNPCNPNPCGDRGNCNINVMDENGFNCFCKFGFSGKLCERTSSTDSPQTAISTASKPMGNDPCKPDPCNGGGFCRNTTTQEGFVCFCTNGNLGNYCEKRNACRISRISGDVTVYKGGQVVERTDAVSEEESVNVECTNSEEDVEGHKILTCNGGDQWSQETKISCVSKESLCTLRRVRSDFEVFFHDGEKVNVFPVSIQSGSFLQLKCLNSNGEKKSSIVRCQNGNWQSSIPSRCVGVTCRNILAPSNGAMTVITPVAELPYEPGVRIRFSCDSYYKLSGAATITCLDDGTWSPEPSACQETGCLLFYLELNNGVYVREHEDKDLEAKSGDKYVLKCKNSDDKMEIQCMGKDRWNPKYNDFYCD